MASIYAGVEERAESVYLLVEKSKLIVRPDAGLSTCFTRLHLAQESTPMQLK